MRWEQVREGPARRKARPWSKGDQGSGQEPAQTAGRGGAGGRRSAQQGRSGAGVRRGAGRVPTWPVGSGSLAVRSATCPLPPPAGSGTRPRTTGPGARALGCVKIGRPGAVPPSAASHPEYGQGGAELGRRAAGVSVPIPAEEALPSAAPPRLTRGHLELGGRPALRRLGARLAWTRRKPLPGARREQAAQTTSESAPARRGWGSGGSGSDAGGWNSRSPAARTSNPAESLRSPQALWAGGPPHHPPWPTLRHSG